MRKNKCLFIGVHICLVCMSHVINNMPTYQSIKHNICSHMSSVMLPPHETTHEVTHENKYTQNTPLKICAKSKLLFTTFQDLI